MRRFIFNLVIAFFVAFAFLFAASFISVLIFNAINGYVMADYSELCVSVFWFVISCLSGLNAVYHAYKENE
jgi:hypothetical protein